jgi:DUF4097 and DUF4098 domain-containing protein YvlB
MAEHRFQTPEPVELEVRIATGRIEIVTVDGDESVVTLEGSDRMLEQTTVDLQGRRLVVEFRGRKHGKLRVCAAVPHRSEANLVTAAADMDLRGRLASLDTKSASGDLVVSGEIERNADLKTVSGDVELQAVGGDLDVKTISGDVHATSVGGSVTAKSVSGDVRVDSVREGHVEVQSVSGDIAVGVAPRTNLDVDAGSVSGDLASEVPLGSEPTGTGDGPTVIVRGRTVSGDFKLFRAA